MIIETDCFLMRNDWRVRIAAHYYPPDDSVGDGGGWVIERLQLLGLYDDNGQLVTFSQPADLAVPKCTHYEHEWLCNALNIAAEKKYAEFVEVIEP